MDKHQRIASAFERLGKEAEATFKAALGIKPKK